MNAGFFMRFFAMFLDLLMMLAVDLIILLIVSFVDYNMITWINITKEAKLQVVQAIKYPVGALFILIPWLYSAFYESSEKQATYGKFLFDMHVTDMAGKRITFARATVRFFGKFLSIAPAFAGFLIALITPQKQALHDLISGTLVHSGKAAREHDAGE